MRTKRTLTERLANHPELEQRFSAILDIVEAESGTLDRADDAEDAVIANLQTLGNEILTDWGVYKEAQKTAEALSQSPGAVARKKYLLGDVLRHDTPRRAPSYPQQEQLPPL